MTDKETMTNKEAITVLKMIECHDPLAQQAKDLAIRALKETYNYQVGYSDGYKYGLKRTNYSIMTTVRLQTITATIKDLMRYDALTVDRFKLLDIIASLHNELHKEVTGKYYDYMFHWSNKGWGGLVNDELFKEYNDNE